MVSLGLGTLILKGFSFISEELLVSLGRRHKGKLKFDLCHGGGWVGGRGVCADRHVRVCVRVCVLHIF